MAEVEAARLTEERHKSPVTFYPGKDDKKASWCWKTFYFHRAMDRMTIKAGLRVKIGTGFKVAG